MIDYQHYFNVAILFHKTKIKDLL